MVNRFVNNKIYTKQLVIKAENETFKNQKSFNVMMRASKVCFEYISKNFSQGSVLLLCGPGNNGGDGLLIAQKLNEAGFSVDVYAPIGIGKTNDSKRALEIIDDSLIITKEKDFNKYKIIVDALFGFQFNKPFNKTIEVLIDKINLSKAKKIAIDIPSGIYCDNGQMEANAFKADITLTFHRLKPCHVLLPGKDFSGIIQVLDINLVNLDDETSLEVISEPSFEPPSFYDHKYSRGELFIFASVEMVGASKLATLIASQVAFKSGVGIVKLLVPEKDIIFFKQHILEELIIPFKNFKDLKSKFRENSTVIFGCGLTNKKINQDTLNYLLKSNLNIVLDAGAFTLMGEKKEYYKKLLKNHSGEKVLSPHIKEFSKLFKISKNKYKDCQLAASEINSVILLKGNDTIISEKGKKAFINYFTSPYLATAGSGDVLAGLIGSFMSQGLTAIDAACSGCFIHSNSAINLNRTFSSMDLIRNIPFTIRKYSK